MDRTEMIKKLSIEKVKTLYWNKNLSVKEVAQEVGTSVWTLYDFMNKNHIPRRATSEVNYVVNKDKPRFRIREGLSAAEQKLKIAGVMLY